LGRPVTLTGIAQEPGPSGFGIRFDLPLALPPDGAYRALVEGVPALLRIDGGAAWLRADVPSGALVTAELIGRDATAAP
jgi:hypothetical protein